MADAKRGKGRFQPADSDDVRREIEELLRRVDALPTLDQRTQDEILGYDESGVPR